jgi:type I restriction enzyme M protein
MEEIRKHAWVLTPGRYVGAADSADDTQEFEEKIHALEATLDEQFAESRRLEDLIRSNLSGIIYAKE